MTPTSRFDKDPGPWEVLAVFSKTNPSAPWFFARDFQEANDWVKSGNRVELLDVVPPPDLATTTQSGRTFEECVGRLSLTEYLGNVSILVEGESLRQTSQRLTSLEKENAFLREQYDILKDAYLGLKRKN